MKRFSVCHRSGWGISALGRVVAAAVLVVGSAAAVSAAGPDARQLLETAGVEGGVVVHVGCDDPQLLAALRATPSFLVQGITQDESELAAAREFLRSRGVYGPVSVVPYSGTHLPYIDNFVNLVIVGEGRQVARDELLRVLTPGGVALIEDGGKLKKIEKPRPAEMDDWTHALHDPTNNAVAHDDLIQPLGCYQWLADQRYSRQHDHMSAISAVVSAGGRVFYIIDEAPRESILIPPDWKLVARDAFNGTPLWSKSIPLWHPHLWRLKSGPQLLTRRLVAVGDRVYVTLRIDGPVSVLDAATGETIRELEGTKATEEILATDDGRLILAVAPEGAPLRSDPYKKYATVRDMEADVTNPVWSLAPRVVMAVDPNSGEIAWKHETDLVPMSLTADAEHVYFHDGKAMQCLDRKTGESVWTSEPLPVNLKMRSSGGATVVAYKDVLLYGGQVPFKNPEFPGSTTIYALSTKTGKLLWTGEHPVCGHMGTPEDILVIDDLAWVGHVAKGADSGTMIGYDVHTGEAKKRFTPDVETHWFHHRCYRAKATDNYLLFSRTGIEFIDPDEEHWICHHWVRGACLYGIMPANGLVYAPEHPCACYLEAKLFGFTALAPYSESAMPRREVPDAERLTTVVAKPKIKPVKLTAEDWPTYRHDPARSGNTACEVPPSQLKSAWKVALGSKLTSPVCAGGYVIVAETDRHTVHAFEAASGRPAWNFTAEGRVDSPPTIWNGRVLFGSADGYVYCLSLDEGELLWRYRVAPEERRMLAFDQLESVWPVHGTPLVIDDVLYCVAGRSMFLDGGLRLVRLDPATGKKLSETIFDDRDPETGENLQVRIEGLNMPVALPDILSSDGRYVYMHSLPLTMEGKRVYNQYLPVTEYEGEYRHLFSPTGFLDDTLWHRTYWVFGQAFASGAGGYYRAGRVQPAGRILVFDDDTVYGYGRHWNYYRWTTPLEFELFATPKNPKVVNAGTERKPIKKNGKRTGQSRVLPVQRFEREWAEDINVQVTSMVLADDVLFAAGPPDTADEERAVQAISDEEVQRRLAEQKAALEGNRGGILIAVSPEDGKLIAGYKLDDMPRFDGLIAAAGRLYYTTYDGKLVCLSPTEGKPLAKEKIIVVPRPEALKSVTQN